MVFKKKMFATEVLGRSLASVAGFSASELLELDVGQLRARVEHGTVKPKQRAPAKQYIVLPVFDSKLRSTVGWIDLEGLLGKVSLV